MRAGRRLHAIAWQAIATALLCSMGVAAAAPPDAAAAVADTGEMPAPAQGEPATPAHDGIGREGEPPAAAPQYRTRSRLSVYFERASVRVGDEALATIAENVERLKGNPRLSVTLVGFAEDLGSSSYSVALAQRRAAVVADLMTSMGVPEQQIRSTSYGREQDDVLPCRTDSCRVSYRRVEFRYLAQRGGG